jgi:hypothetical protein
MMDIRDMLTKLTLLEGSGVTPGAGGQGFKTTGSTGVKPTGVLKHGMPMKLNTASPGSMREDDVEEGNEFSGELAKAKAAGKKEFEVDGKTYPVREAKKAKPDFLDVDKDGDRKESFKKAVRDKAGKKSVKENLRLVRETALGDRQIRVYHDREYQEYHVCVTEGDTVVSRQFAGSTQEATDLVRSIVSEARGMKVAWPGTPEYREKTGTQTRADFRKKHAGSVMRDPAARQELEKIDTEYEAGKGRYGKEEEPDDEEGTKKAARDPNTPKRGRGRPKGTKRSIGAKGPTGRSKLLTREDYDQDEYDEEGEMAKSQSRTIADAAEELQSMISDQENLPEWVQKKISLAQEYIDSARDYLEANRPEDSEEEMPLPEGSTGDYSAKKARAGKDIGKPGKQFAKIAKSAGERYGSKERGEKVAGAVLAKLRAKEDVQMEGAYRDVDDKTGKKIVQWLEYHSDGVFDDNPYLGDALIRLANKWETGDMSFRELKDAVLGMFEQGEWQRADFIQKFAPNKVKITQPDLFNEEEITEKAVSKAQRAAAGIARAAQKGDIPKSELRGASRKMAKMPAGELKKFAKTKEKGLPEKVREVDTGEADARRTTPSSEEHNEKTFAKHRERVNKERRDHDKESDEKPVKETTTAGSVATAPAEGGKKSKGGIQFGKGIYEAQLAESFDAEIARVLDEGTTITINSPDNGDASVSINGTGEDAMALANLLKMAGLFASDGYHGACSSCGQMHEGDCRVMEEDLANSANNTETMSTDYMVNGLSGGLNGPKQQVNPNNMADNPLAMKNLGKAPSGQINLGAIAEEVQREAEDRLLDLYKRIV